MTYSGKLLSKRAKHLTVHISWVLGALAAEEDKAMEPGDQRYRLSEAEDRESVARLGEDGQEAAGKGLLSMGGDKRDKVLGTLVLLVSNHMQCIGPMQQFIDEATALSKKCINQLVFTDKPSKAPCEQGATTCVEATA